MSEERLGTAAEERAKFINEAAEFKKEFPLGFRQVFSGNSIATIKEHARTEIEGLLQPIKNEVAQTVSDFLSNSGLVELIKSITKVISETVTKIVEAGGLKDTMAKANPVVKQIADAIAIYFGWISEIWSIWTDWLTIPPPPQDPNDIPPSFTIPGDIINLPDPTEDPRGGRRPINDDIGFF